MFLNLFSLFWITIIPVICIMKKMMAVWTEIINFMYFFVFLNFMDAKYINISTHKNRTIPFCMYSPINIPSMYPMFNTSIIFIFFTSYYRRLAPA